jgi:four helix bundle protein
MKNYKELEVWQQGVELAVKVYQQTRTLPAEEKFGLTSQIQRAATSIPANIAEGWGRGSTKEYIQFLRVARGSLMELETHLILAARLGYFSPERLAALQKEVEVLGKRINSLIRSLGSR